MRAKKSLGQNFLRDEAMIEKCLLAVSPKKGESIMEIGPGQGAITQDLVESGAQIHAIELDDRMIPILEEKFSAFENLHLVHENILRMHIDKYVRDEIKADNYRVVGNLPYYITSAIIRQFLEVALKPTEMYFMVQKEVGERIAAKPGAMSILSVAVQYYSEPEILFDVPKNAFEPVPKVDSAFMKLTTKKEDADRNKYESSFFRVVKAGFCARRKTLENNLSNSLHIDKEKVRSTMMDLAIDENIRAQELTLEQWRLLQKALDKFL